MLEKWLEYSEEVLEAKKANKPVVALESTIISHGMPYPQNVQTAKEVEDIIRKNGAVPATIAILNGKIKIGLSDEELEFLAQSRDVEKTSRRDLPYLIAKKKNGATTVAATMICAELAGIEVFVTGGIGGVHREAETTMDISADLQELAMTNVAVICAGAKSILDIGLTLEYLETYGVPVVGFETDVLPAFYTRTSPFNVNYRVNTAEEAAEMIRTKWALGLKGGVVIANPIPEKDALEEEFITGVIETALKEANENNISGKKVTPFLLEKVKELTEGRSLTANIALVKHNAEVGSRIAVSLHK
ncbi:pseudouridine-5'-phosphate glycosidase [Cytobacillus firmus]|uniref:pseudouridine-5'-phosphate glycosidase n=1 Tax=Cytobacillus firmus TaxID=1399 RepID=UPI00077C65CF|nr:pseudouridine-5'-phosphate glycosidase [Cytobacillus firmus]MBG9543811.1 pseudouridine-5'-phosphate glycosidase [Cytobacillus firmus]MBG9546884.1 pseudouridine-5'-phosphate glycosidase [Cytobacillus firmus]MBG9552627.1 pseudouridine-5'-phosphate glycosidase [Cytobacillus firmus]MBG9556942.1 pseudouridine-5'-phosphate glycosidase [Cytobacillus firmus]MBG9574166.1 pseudouridine-5'-phosphate glycosidase [Cytobacillus firmus]